MATFLENAPTAADRSTWPLLPASESNPEHTVLISAPYLMPHLERFTPIFAAFGLTTLVPEVEERMEEAQILEHAGAFDACICGDDRYTVAAIEACLPRLKVISKWGTGIDSIDKPAAMERGVKVGNTLNAFSKPVSDSIMGYMLAFARQQPMMDREMKSGRWQKHAGKSLSECTVGIIGMGNIGQHLARRCWGFETTTLAYDIVDVDPALLERWGVTMVGSLEELYAAADFVCVTCQLTEHTRGMVNAEAFAAMKDSAVLINCARGPIVDEAALIAALQAESGGIAGAGLDVFEHEPLPADSPLMGMDCVMMAPHNSNSSPQAHENIHWSTLRNLLNGLGVPFEQQHEIQAESVCE